VYQYQLVAGKSLPAWPRNLGVSTVCRRLQEQHSKCILVLHIFAYLITSYVYDGMQYAYREEYQQTRSRDALPGAPQSNRQRRRGSGLASCHRRCAEEKREWSWGRAARFYGERGGAIGRQRACATRGAAGVPAQGLAALPANVRESNSSCMLGMQCSAWLANRCSGGSTGQGKWRSMASGGNLEPLGLSTWSTRDGGFGLILPGSGCVGATVVWSAGGSDLGALHMDGSALHLNLN
jgi:hypothetical protein